MSIIRALREFLAGCPCLGLLTGGIKTDWTDAAGDYAVLPLGETVIERYMDGAQRVQYQCQLAARRFTKADLERVENAEFFEAFSRWIAEQDAAGRYPALGEGRCAEALTCTGGALVSLNETGREGSYRVLLTMEYERRKV